MSQYICYNGENLPESNKLMLPFCRGLALGDSISETMFVTGKDVLFWEDHLRRLNRAMKLMQMRIPEKFLPGNYTLYGEIMKLLHRHKLFQGIKLTITVFRNGANDYFSEENGVSYIIEAQKLPYEFFPFNKNGVEMDVFSEYCKPVNVFSEFEGTGKLHYILAGQFCLANRIENCFIMNENWNICEAIEANLFLVKEKHVLTPSLKEGCINGVLRKTTLDILANMGFTIFDQESIKFEHLLNADEILLVNQIWGVQWVRAFRHKRYFNKTGYPLTKAINTIMERRKKEMNNLL
jgi:branched-chain amino acid aminotransferase